MVNVLFQNIQLSISEETTATWSGTGCLPTPWKDMITTGTAQTLPVLELPEDFPLDKSTIYPEFYFSVFADQPFKVRASVLCHFGITDWNRLFRAR